MSDYSRSPLFDPDFINQASARDPLADALSSGELAPSIVVADREGNDLAVDGTLARDLLEMNYAQLEQKYGREIADNQFDLQAEFDRQRQVQTANRTNTEVVRDTTLGAVAGFMDLAGGLTAAGLSGAGAVDEYFDEENTGLGELGVATAQNTQRFTDWIRSGQTNELAERQELSQIEGQLDALDSAAQYERDIADGDNDFIASLTQVGRDVLDTGERVLRDGPVAADIIAQGVGSLGPSAKLAGAASRFTTGVATRAGATQGVQRAAQTLGAATGVGVAEASGSLSDAISQVMEMDHDTLLTNSPHYRGLIEEGMSPEDARTQVASITGRVAFARQLPTAAAFGLISARFEAAPIGSFAGAGFLGSLRQIGSQAIEEAAQGGSGTLNVNAAIQGYADETRSLTEGVGEQIATGAIAGAGMAGVLSGPAGVINTGRAVGDFVSGDTPSDILAAAGRIGGDALDLTQRGVQRASEAAAPYVAPVVDAARPVAQAVNERVVQPVSDVVTDLAEKPNTRIQGEVVVASEQLSALVQTAEATDTSVDVLRAPRTASVPQSFSDYVSEGDTLVDTVSGIAKSLAFGKSKANTLPESDVIFAYDNFQQLKNSTDKLPESLKAAAEDVLRSPDFKRLQRRMSKIDLNQSQTNETEVNAQTMADTVGVARNNPTNVNPEFVQKILKHSDRNDLSDEDVRLLEAASSIAQAVNNHKGEKVQISKDNVVALSQKPAYKANPSKLPQPLSEEGVSRSIQVGGFTDKRGNKLRSVNDFAADIFKGGQNPDGDFTYVNDEGYSVSSVTVANQFSKFVTHMKNKVEALNTSFDLNENGKGPSIGFDSLVRGEKIIKAGQAGAASPVAYHRNSPKSVAFARNVFNDALVATEVYNTLVDTFPEMFPGGKLELPTLKLEGQDNTTAVEEEASPEAGASDEQTQTTEDTVSEDIQDDPQTEDAVVGSDDDAVDDLNDVNVQSDDQLTGVSETFSNTFTPSGKEVEFSDTDSLIGLVENQEYQKFVRLMVKPVMKAVNKRLTSITVSKKDTRTLQEVATSGDTETMGYQRFKALNAVNPETGQYQDQLLSMATVAVLDWMTGARAPDASRLDETLDDLGLNYNDLSREELFDIANGVSIRQVSEALGKQVVRLWNVEVNQDAPIEDIRGISEGLIKEVLTVLGEGGKLIEIKTIPVRLEDGRMGSTETINVSKMRDIQKRIGLNGQNAVQKLLLPEINENPSFGEKLTHVDQTQSRGDVPLSKNEKDALRAIQNTPHYVSEGVVGFVEAIGFEGLSRILGYVDMDTFRGNDVISRSVEGKNLSIERDFEDALSVAQNARDMGEKTPVYYPVGISKVGRHQMKGINPQNNKILRGMVTPTFSTLDMTNQEDHDAFWLTVAQASGLNKVENESHKEILKTVQTEFFTKYGEAVDVALEWVKTGELNTQEFVDAMGTADMAEITSVIAVAQLQFAKENGTETSFETSLSFELDGKTDGPANMMSNFGQGLLTKQDMSNFNRVGYFLGRKAATLNQYFSAGNSDLYEVTSKTADRVMFSKANTAKNKSDRELLLAASRFAAHFGDFKINQEDGQITMTRNTSKNPMTKTVYGSGVRGVGVGIAHDMMLNFYKAFVDGPSVDEYPGYGQLRDDIKVLFGDDLPDNFNTAEMAFGGDSVKRFEEIITKTLGDIIAGAAKDTIGSKITNVNGTLVLMSNIQSEYLIRKFDEELAALAEQRAQEGKIGRNNKGEPIVRQLSQRDYNRLVKKMSVMAPLYSKESGQTLAVGSFSPQTSNFVLSSNLSEKMRQKGTLVRPDEAGVKVVPYVTISTDAMMMNRIYGAENAPTDTIPVFDGIDMPVSRVKEYAGQINQAVLANWDEDILGMIKTDFDSFLRHVGSDPLLDEALSAALEKAENSTVTAKTVQEVAEALDTIHKKNQARKRAFKRIPVSVDHMGGSDSSYGRGGNLEEMDRAKINALIQEELDKQETPVLKPSEEYTELGVSTGEATLEAVMRETKSNIIRQTLRAIKNKLPADLKMVTGSLAQLNEYRKENFKSDGQILTGAGNFDQNNNAIFLAKNGEETLVHELVHAATHEQIKAHYNGETNTAVERLETLMDEFMGLDFSNSSKEVRDAVNATRAEILETQIDSKADAVSEFVAWSLTNEQLAKTLKETRTGIVATFSKKVLQLIKKLMGGVPTDMFSNIVFNVKLLDSSVPVPPVDNGGDNNGNGGGNDDDGVTPPARKYTNFWIDLVRQRLEENKVPGLVKGKSQRARTKQTLRYQTSAQDAVDKLDFGGFSLSEYEKQTFKAIHMVLAAEMRLDTKSMLAMKKSFDFVTDNLTPEMFGPNNAQDRYSTVMDLFGATKNDEGVSDAIAVLLALSQTSRGFRRALDQLPTPENQNQETAGLNEFLAISTQFMMRKAVGSVELAGQEVKDVLDQLAENIIIQDQEKEYSLLRNVMTSLDKADAVTSGIMSEVAERTANLNEDVQASNRAGLTKFVSGSVAFATSFLDTKRSAIAADAVKTVTHMGQTLDNFVPVREFVAEVIGTDETNKETVALLDRTNKAVSGVRQAFREDLPVILQDAFVTPPTAEQWNILHKVLGKGDFSALFDLSNADASMDLITKTGLLNRKVQQAEKTITSNFGKDVADTILEKSQQLAEFMNGNGAGHQLWRNAHAINKLAGAYDEAMTVEIDRLVSLYALQGLTDQEADTVAEMYANDADGVKNLIVYMQGLNLEEDSKVITEDARMNGYKGFIPNHPKQGTRLVIQDDSRQEELERMGFVRVGSYTAEVEFSSTKRGYYFSTTKQGGGYSQGVLQNVHDTYRGVDATTGLTINGMASGILSVDAMGDATDSLNKAGRVRNVKEVLMPVYSDQGLVAYYERALNPDMVEEYLQPQGNLALMLGSWAGRQVEEKFAQRYNNELIDQLKDVYDNREVGSDGLFVDLSASDLKDRIYADTWRTIPAQTKSYILQVFGDEGFPVRKDMINVALGYREASVLDVWTGKTRMPEAVTTTVRALANMTIGRYDEGNFTVKGLAAGEDGIQAVISAVKDNIVVRSLVVLYMNLQANVIQLTNRGVGPKAIIRGYRDKFQEIETYNENEKKLIRLDTQIRLAANDKNRVAILETQRQAIYDENARMSIAPLISAGAYKNISEGITDLDVELTSGRVGDWLENQVGKLPSGLSTVVKYGIVAKDTALYKGANKAVQYGDFLAKAVMYDHLFENGATHDEAIAKINEEYVNFSTLPGRTRSYLESMGLTWFLTFKIRIMKIALQMMRENPVRSLLIANTVGDLGSPVADNLASVVAQDRLDYSLGWDMLFGSPELNPWVNMVDWASE